MWALCKFRSCPNKAWPQWSTLCKTSSRLVIGLRRSKNRRDHSHRSRSRSSSLSLRQEWTTQRAIWINKVAARSQKWSNIRVVARLKKLAFRWGPSLQLQKQRLQLSLACPQLSKYWLWLGKKCRVGASDIMSCAAVSFLSNWASLAGSLTLIRPFTYWYTNFAF